MTREFNRLGQKLAVRAFDGQVHSTTKWLLQWTNALGRVFFVILLKHQLAAVVRKKCELVFRPLVLDLETQYLAVKVQAALQIRDDQLRDQ